MIDFTAYRTPILAVTCPSCRARPGAWCVRPSEHKAQDLHDARGREADRLFIEQHGERASIEWRNGQYVIDPEGYAKAHPDQFEAAEPAEPKTEQQELPL